MRKVRCRNGFKENCCHEKSLVTDAVQAVKKKELPMSETRNALAELAEWLKQLVDANGGKKCRAVANIDKAQRIVSELAKVKDRREGETNSDALWRCNDCIAKCRVIAEEGARDGK